MTKCYFCGESNPLVLENAHLIPQSIGSEVFKDSKGKVNINKTITLCRNCHKKFEMLLRPFVKYAQVRLDDKNQEEGEHIEIFGYLADCIPGQDGSFLSIYDRHGFDITPFASLPIANRDVVDKALLLKSDGKYGKFVVKNGFVLDIIPVETPKEEVKTVRTSRSLREKLAIVLALTVKMEEETGMVKTAKLLKKLKSEFKVSDEEAKALMGELIRDGRLYSPKKGYLKKT